MLVLIDWTKELNNGTILVKWYYFLQIILNVLYNPMWTHTFENTHSLHKFIRLTVSIISANTFDWQDSPTLWTHTYDWQYQSTLWTHSIDSTYPPYEQIRCEQIQMTITTHSANTYGWQSSPTLRTNMIDNTHSPYETYN